MKKGSLLKATSHLPRRRTLLVPQSYLSMMNPNHSNKPSFFDLPLEIRLGIYHYCLVHSEPISIGSLYHSKLEPLRNYEVQRRSILLVCRQTYREAVEVMYENRFLIFTRDDAMISGLRKEDGFDLFKVRHLTIIIENEVHEPIRCGTKHQF